MRALDFALNRILPEDLRSDSYDMSKKGVAAMMASLARSHPDQYREVSKRMGDLGRKNAFLQGFTIGPDDTQPVIDTSTYYTRMDVELAALRAQKLPADDFDSARNEILQRYSDLIEKDTMGAALKSNNSFAKSVASGARGNPAHVKAILSTPGIYADAQGNIIPLFVRNSFASGVRPAETLAGTYGGRAAVISTKVATARGGDYSKILNQSTSHYNVTEKDCGVSNGLDFEPSDPSLRGRVLARDVAGLKAGSVIDKHALAAIRRQDQPVIARSPMTCKSAHGLCAHCAGLQADGNFPRVGDSLGITAGQSVGEPIVQSGLNAKHNCLEEGSLVRMADYSVRRIQDIRPGDHVLGADISGNTFSVAVKALWDQGLQPVNEYVYRLAPSKQTLSVRCTADHLILQTTHYSGAKEAEFNHTPRKIPAGRLPGRPAVVMPRDHRPADNLVSEPLASVVGYFLGDGIRLYEDSGSVRVSCACSQTVFDLREILGKFDMRIEKAKRSHDWFIAGGGNSGRERGPNGQFLEGDYRSRLRQLLGELGMDGCYAHDKTLPEAAWGWDQDSVAKLVAGFVAADGSVYRNKSKAPGVSFCSTARPMLVSLKEIMEVRFGVYATALTRTGKADVGNRKHDMWAFTVTRRDQVARFNQAFGRYIVGGKGSKLMDYLKEAPATSVFASLPYMEGRRATVTPIGERQCWDISVDHPDELFVMANGVIVKNSGAAKGKKEFSGFDVVSQFAQIPDEFKDKATVSERDGVITAVREAPQGGHYVSVDDVSHFVLPGFDLLVKPGDTVEAGDQLADGLINPSDIVRLRGLGEGRRYYADRLEKILTDSGQPPDRRNIELIARATVDHLRIDDADEDSDFLPDDLVREADYMQSYKQPEDTADTPLHKATGLYLQQPVLHFTVGTRITPKIAERMRKVGATNVFASPTAPPFTPDMQRLRTASHSDKDWMASLSTSYLGKQMTQSAERGDETDLESNYHYAPRLAYGVGFGEDIERTGKF